jgi:hypothetical protein
MPFKAKNIYKTEHAAYEGAEQHMETGLIICALDCKWQKLPKPGPVVRVAKALL